MTARTLSATLIQNRTESERERHGFLTVLRHQPTSHCSTLQTSPSIFFCHFNNLPPQTQTQTPIQCVFSTPLYLIATLSLSQSHHRFQNLLSFQHSPPPFHPSSHAHCFRSSTPVSFCCNCKHHLLFVLGFSLLQDFYFILLGGYFLFTSVSVN